MYFLNQSNFLVHILLKIVIGVLLLVVVLVALVAVLVCITKKCKLWCHSKEAKKLTQIRQRSGTCAEMSGTNMPHDERPEIDWLQAEQCLIIPTRRDATLKQILSAKSTTASSSASRSSSSIQIGQTIPSLHGTSTSAQQAVDVNAAAVNIDVPDRSSQSDSNSNLRRQRATEYTRGYENVSDRTLNLLGGNYSIPSANKDNDTNYND